MIRSTYLRSAAGYFLDRGTSLGTGFIMMIAVARCYPAVEVGQFSFAYTLLQTSMTALILGLEPYLIKTFVGTAAADRYETMAGAGLNVAFLALVFSIAAASVLVATDAPRTDVGALLLALGGAILASPLLVVESYLKAIERVELVGLYRSAVLLPGLAIKIWLAVRGAPLVWICWIVTAEYWLLALIALVMARGLITGLPFCRLLRHSRETFSGVMSVAGASLLLALYLRAPNMMMPGLAGFADLASFTLTFQLVQIPVAIGQTALSAIYPRFVIMAQSGDRQGTEKFAQRLMFICVVAAYCVAGICFLFGSSLLGLIFGSRYQGAGSILWVLALSLPIMLTGNVRAYLIYIANQPRLHVINTLIGLVAIWSIGSILIPRFSGIGAAIAYTIATAVSSWLTSFLFEKTRAAGRMQFNAFLMHYPS